jgi:hypothetical protein
VDGVGMEREHLSEVIEEFGWWISRRTRHMMPPWWCSEIADNRHRVELPENPINILLSGQNARLING